MKQLVLPSSGTLDSDRFQTKALGTTICKRILTQSSLLFLAIIGAVALGAPASHAQLYGLTQRVVQGRTLDANGQPLPNAIVYLQNDKTNEIRTYITRQDGSYRFGQLSSDVDYRLWAKLEKMKSKAKTISSFDSKKLFIFDLKLEPAK